MALREAIGAEALDLPETVVGELFVVALGQHALDELPAEFPDIAVVPEGRHGAA